jgi:hypothetical protein
MQIGGGKFLGWGIESGWLGSVFSELIQDWGNFRLGDDSPGVNLQRGYDKPVLTYDPWKL